jgi:hypothetical protein
MGGAVDRRDEVRPQPRTIGFRVGVEIGVHDDEVRA